MGIFRAATAPFRKRPLQCAVRYKKFEEIVGVPRLSGRTRASGNPAENKLIVRNGTVTIGGIALSAARSKLHRHEDAIRVVHIIAERFARGEPTSGVELASGLKSSHEAVSKLKRRYPRRFASAMICRATARATHRGRTIRHRRSAPVRVRSGLPS